MKEKKRQLKWSMIAMLTICWFLPLMFLSLVMLFVVNGKINRQLTQTIETSADQAIDICQIRLNEAMSASKDASYLPEIKDSYEEYLQSGDVKKLHHDVKLFLQQQYRYNSDFRMTVLYFVDRPNDLFYTYQSPKLTYAEVKDFQENAQKEIAEIAEELDTNIAFVNIGGKSYMVRNIVNSRFKPIAVLVMELDLNHMFGSLKSIWGYEKGDVFIDGNSMLNIYEEEPYEGAPEVRNMEEAIYYHGGENAYVYKRMETGRHRVTYGVTLDSDAIAEEILLGRVLLLLVVVFMIPLIIIVFYFFDKHVNKPIASLRKAFQEIEKEKYGYKIEDEKLDEEFDVLKNKFNSMSDRLQYLFEKIYLEELALRDANIMALQSQINPHFLNNTLEIINWEARMNGNRKVSSMIEALSTMLEATMNRKNVQLIPLSEELSYVDAYLYIIGQRFGENFSCSKEIDESLLSVKVPRLIIQPIIENAVEHGMNIREGGQVSLRVYRKADKVYIEVMDNGVLTGKDKDRIFKLLNEKREEGEQQTSLSLGIRNVNERLKIIYGEECGLTIVSNAQGNTVSTIIVKMEQADGQ